MDRNNWQQLQIAPIWSTLMFTIFSQHIIFLKLILSNICFEAAVCAGAGAFLNKLNFCKVFFWAKKVKKKLYMLFKTISCFYMFQCFSVPIIQKSKFMSNMIFIFTPTKLKSKINFYALRINKKLTFYCDKLSIEMKKSQLHTQPHSTQFR